MNSNLVNRVQGWLKSRRFWKRFFIYCLGLPFALIIVLVLVVYIKQDSIVQGLINDLNKDFYGSTEIKDSHISMFENFPYISIDLEDFKVYETKEDKESPIVDVKDLYIGFNLWTIITGQMEIKKIKIVDGDINLVQHKSGDFNIVKALSSKSAIESPEEEFHLDLKKIELKNVDISKLNEANNLKIEAFVQNAISKFKTSEANVRAALDANFVLNIISNNDTTFFKHKHLALDTDLEFIKGKDALTIQPTTVTLEDSNFDFKGSIDFRNDVDLDLQFNGNKSNFDLLIALMPEELMKELMTYDNSGDITLEARVRGKSINGNNPSMMAKIGCTNGRFTNLETKKSIQGLNFEASFTNGEKRAKETMKFEIKNLKATPEAGNFNSSIRVKDFNAPEITAKLHTEINLDFVSKFFQFKHIQNLKGKASIDLDYHDIVDLERPENVLTQLSESYQMDLKLSDVGFKLDTYELPVKDFNLSTKIRGHEASIVNCDIKIGRSDLHVTGIIDDLPAIIHHSEKPVDTKLKIKSNYLDIYQLTGADSLAIDEQVKNLSMDFDFKASAKSFTESKYLPVGEFFIENLHAQLKHYPHTFHDFHADVFVDERDLRVVDFKGMIDKSDFQFSGKLEHYEKWFDEQPGGESKIEFNLASKMLQLESLFTYKGENYVPEEYRHEEFDDLKIHGFTYLHYVDKLKSLDLNIDEFKGKMKVHPLKFENFKGRIHYESEHLVVEDFHGKLGNSSFKTTLHWYLGENEKIRQRDNHFSITASRLDVDQLIKYNPAPTSKNGKSSGAIVDHDAGFNIYELPFTKMTYHVDIGQLNYHRLLLSNVKGELSTTPNHYIHIHHLGLDAAGGHFDIKGYFNGSNPDLIYFSPEIYAKNVDLDKLMFKFENFGQDYLVSDNLHGKFKGKITGKIHMHSDLVPKLDDSEVHLDLDVTHGKLENYSLLQYMSDYFKDKNLNQVLFDTLNNHIDIKEGVITIPKMTVNSSLGHIKISGKQTLSGQMEYYLSIPWKMVTKTASAKLFGKKESEEVLASQVDEIQYKEEKSRYVNVKITSDENGYKFSLGKDKSK